MYCIKCGGKLREFLNNVTLSNVAGVLDIHLCTKCSQATVINVDNNKKLLNINAEWYCVNNNIEGIKKLLNLLPGNPQSRLVIATSRSQAVLCAVLVGIHSNSAILIYSSHGNNIVSNDIKQKIIETLGIQSQSQDQYNNDIYFGIVENFVQNTVIKQTQQQESKQTQVEAEGMKKYSDTLAAPEEQDQEVDSELQMKAEEEARMEELQKILQEDKDDIPYGVTIDLNLIK